MATLGVGIAAVKKLGQDNGFSVDATEDANSFTSKNLARYRAVVESTLDFVLRELATSDGGFASALDADSEGEEGRFYVWTDAELRSVLAEAGLSASEADEVARYWDVTPEGNWEGRSILRGSGSPPDAELIARARKSLLAARGRRVRPARDEKQIAAWQKYPPGHCLKQAPQLPGSCPRLAQ